VRFLTTNYCTETATTVTASTSDANFPASNLKNPLRSKRWRSTSVDEQTIVFDLQTTEEINSVVLLWPKIEGIRLTDDVVIKIQANGTNVWTSPSVDQVLTIDNDYSVASHFFSTDQSYRYWRVYIDDPTNTLGYIELGQVWLGKSLDIDNAQNGFKFGLVDRTNVISNEYGHKYFDEYPQTAMLEFSYANIEYEDVQILENAFRTNGSKKPVIVVLDETETVFDKDHYLIYGTMSPQFGFGHVNYNVFNSDGIKIEELS
jgi:hypothetical protein